MHTVAVRPIVALGLARPCSLWAGEVDLMEIEGREVATPKNYLDPVTYIPGHAQGNAGHRDCEPGVIIGVTMEAVRVLYCKTRTVQSTRPRDLVWG